MKKTPNSNNSTNLDLLRSVAVLYVVLDHTLKLTGVVTFFGVDIAWFGHLGVMFFFVHTCLVLMMSLERSYKPDASPLTLAANFYTRRIFRIYPLSIFAVVIAVLSALPVAQIDGPYAMSAIATTKAGLLSNLFLVQTLTHRPSIIGPLWSLPFELQMYVFLPVIFLFLARKGRLAALLAIWALGLGFEYLLQPHAFFVPHFISGVIAFVMIKRQPRPSLPAWAWPASLVLITGCFLALRPSFITGAAVCLLLGVSLPRFERLESRVVNSITHNIAKYSYGVYLSHMFVMWLAFIYLRAYPMTARVAFFLGLMAVLPVILYKAIEEPGIQVGAKLADNLFFIRPRLAKTPKEQTAEELEETASGL
jgi:peptidoglycan/LPS O-acetylase OafA/YrhL